MVPLQCMEWTWYHSSVRNGHGTTPVYGTGMVPPQCMEWTWYHSSVWNGHGTTPVYGMDMVPLQCMEWGRCTTLLYTSTTISSSNTCTIKQPWKMHMLIERIEWSAHRPQRYEGWCGVVGVEWGSGGWCGVVGGGVGWWGVVWGSGGWCGVVGGGGGWWGVVWGGVGWCGVVGGGVGCYTDKQNSHQAKKCSDKPAQEYNVLKRPRSIVVTTRSKRYDLVVSCLCSIKQCAKKHTCLMFPTGTFNSTNVI